MNLINLLKEIYIQSPFHGEKNEKEKKKEKELPFFPSSR